MPAYVVRAMRAMREIARDYYSGLGAGAPE